MSAAPGRVQNIKKHFESNVSAESALYQTGHLLSKGPTSPTTAVKRSPAFRNDRVAPRKTPVPTPRVAFLGAANPPIKSAAAAKASNGTYGSVLGQPRMGVALKKSQQYGQGGQQTRTPLNKVLPVESNYNKHAGKNQNTKAPEMSGSKLVKVSPVRFPSSNEKTTPPKMTTFSPQKGSKVQQLSRQMEDILKSPLPKGPPPQKPPRTFAHGTPVAPPPAEKRPPVRSVSGPLRPATVRRPSVPPPAMPPRSKTESQIVRKKGAGRGGARALLAAACVCPPPQYADAKIGHPVAELARSHSMEHVYAVPFVPKQEDGVPIQVNSPSHAERNKREGLYYMSTPIQWPSRPNHLPLNSNTFTPQQQQVRGLKSPPPCAKVLPTLRESPKVVLEPIVDHNRIQMLVNEAFNSVQLATPDPSTDSEDCLTPGESEISFADRSSPSEDDTDEEVKRLVEKRKGYVKRASSFAIPQTRGSLDASENHLFECILLVGLNLHQHSNNYQPFIKSKFPVNAQVPDDIKLFVFPDAQEWPPMEGSEHKRQYSIVLTSDSGARSYGYCQRIVPEGMNLCLPLAYCIVTKHKASGFFYKLLADFESRHGQSEASRLSLLSSLQFENLPPPGGSLRVPGLTIHRPMDQRLEDSELSTLYSSLPHRLILRLVASVLHERQLVLTSSSLSKLTACVMALQAALEPFQWQHTLVAALPSDMTEICHAPTPYIIGLLKSKSGKIPDFSLEEGIAVDLDSGKTLRCVGDECKILPVRLQKALFKVLQLASSTGENEPTRNVLVSEAFVRLFVEACGHYKNHVVTQQDGRIMFERESFVKAVESKSLQMFLEWFTETSLFCTFIDDRTRRSVVNSIFDTRVLQNFKESEENLVKIIKNRKVINKKVKTFGNRIRDLVH
ncbi:DENN domain-containing protein 2B-like [Neocloeon triangulifer]|uniref:DENN domain-containing protein 2B-like n=1 Tax=Neocloeon triangulifer TaxID=2078957 RepID=UPI00286EE34A|nr:DENN domain-containing protein 2B-like [Neocloeon triangulifer]